MFLQIWQSLTSQWGWYAGLIEQHLAISFIAIAISCVIGGIAGVLISQYQRAAKPTLGVVNFLYTIPSISMLGFLIPFSGVGNATAVIALCIYALLPIVRGVHTGLTNISPEIIEAAKGMGSTDSQIMRRIRIPLAMPIIMSSVRNMATMTIALAGIASFIGAGGLGVAIYRGITTKNDAMTICGSLLCALLAVVVDWILGRVQKAFQRKRRRAKMSHARKVTLGVVIAVVCAGVAGAGVYQAISASSHIKMATKPMTEEYIMGYMVKDLVEHDTNLTVDVSQGIGGGTSNIEPGMESGQFDLYPEYTGTAWANVLKHDDVYNDAEYNQLTQEYSDNLNMSWVGMYGFNDMYAIGVRKDIAEKYDLKTISDLARVAPNVTFGAEYDFFGRADGYSDLQQTYGINFKQTMDMDSGLKYSAIESGQIDAMSVYTTDGKLSDGQVVVLEDDKHMFPSYECGNVVRNQVLQQHPELAGELEKLAGTISNSDMSSMNAQVENDGRSPKDVADDFLSEKGLI